MQRDQSNSRRGEVFISEFGHFIPSKPWSMWPVMGAEEIDRLGDVFHLPRPLWPPDVGELFAVHGAGLLAGTVDRYVGPCDDAS